MQDIGFIGLGIMGSRMATNLQNQGYSLAVHNRSKEKAESLLKGGAEWAPSAAKAVHNTSVVITMLSTPEVVSEMALGELGFLDHMKAGSIWMNCSTVNPIYYRI